MELLSIPKIELHAHLSGSISDQTINDLMKYRKTALMRLEGCKLGVEHFGSEMGAQSLDRCFEVFKVLHILTDNIINVRIIAESVIEDFYHDQVEYLELRTTPKSVEGSYCKKEYLETILRVIIEKEREYGILVRLLISFDRSKGIESAKENLILAKQFQNNELYGPYVCGIEVSGDPNSSSLIDYIPLLEDAKANGLKIAVHLLEVKNAVAFEEAKELITKGLVDRIGHGTFLHPLSGGCLQLYEAVKERKIPIEMCITSNIKCGTVKNIEDHHLKYWKVDNHPIAICTDDKGVFSTSLSEEIALYMKIVNGTIEDVYNVQRMALNAAFIEEHHKVMKSSGEEYLASMPSKFRKTIWVKRGDFVIAESIPEGQKVKYEIVRILSREHMKYYIKENVWPSDFLEDSSDTKLKCGYYSDSENWEIDCLSVCNPNKHIVNIDLDEGSSSETESNSSEDIN